jgi:hypothetical protein
VLLCVVRLADVETDLLISLNVPMKSAKQNLAACQTAPARSQDPGNAWRGCTALLKPYMLGQTLIAAPTIAEMLHIKVSNSSDTPPSLLPYLRNYQHLISMTSLKGFAGEKWYRGIGMSKSPNV